MPGQFPDRKGKILLFDFARPNNYEELTIKWQKDAKRVSEEFNPHGIDVLIKGDKTIIYVVNHEPYESVERFSLDLKSKTLNHLESIRDPLFTYLNSIIAVDERSFLFTNCFYSKDLITLEIWLDLHLGNVGAYDGDLNKATIVKDGFHIPNGLGLSTDKTKLYLADIGNLALQTFDINSLTNLTLSYTLHLDTMVDNIQVDPMDGSLWLGCQPSFWNFLLYLEDPVNRITGSHILTVKTDTHGNPTGDIVELYRNNGTEISLSSVALHYKKKLLIGSVFDKLLFCEIKTIY